jgi:hypothetical protein
VIRPDLVRLESFVEKLGEDEARLGRGEDGVEGGVGRGAMVGMVHVHGAVVAHRRISAHRRVRTVAPDDPRQRSPVVGTILAHLGLLHPSALSGAGPAVGQPARCCLLPSVIRPQTRRWTLPLQTAA